MNSVELVCAGERLELLAAKAAYWSSARLLLIADVHLGKAAAFRQAGVPVPEQVTAADLHRLSTLLHRTGAQRLVILGDLFHARSGQTDVVLNTFQTWRSRHALLPIDLLLGNHDAAMLPFPNDWGIQVSDELHRGPFLFAHQVRTVPGQFGMFGHAHPAVRWDGMRLPCFQVWNEGMILPAFGSFTGTHPVESIESQRIFTIHAGEIVELPTPFAGRMKRGFRIRNWWKRRNVPH